MYLILKIMVLMQKKKPKEIGDNLVILYSG